MVGGGTTLFAKPDAENFDLQLAHFVAEAAYKVWVFQLALGATVGAADYAPANDLLFAYGSRLSIDCELPFGFLITGTGAFTFLGRNDMAFTAGLGIGSTF